MYDYFAFGYLLENLLLFGTATFKFAVFTYTMDPFNKVNSAYVYYKALTCMSVMQVSEKCW